MSRSLRRSWFALALPFALALLLGTALAFHGPAGVAAQSGAPAVPAHQWPPDNTSDLSLTTYL